MISMKRKKMLHWIRFSLEPYRIDALDISDGACVLSELRNISQFLPRLNSHPKRFVFHHNVLFTNERVKKQQTQILQFHQI